MVAIGIFAKKFSKTSADFLIAGHNLGLGMCVAATVGEFIGGTSTIGTAEGGYTYGLSASWYSIANAIGLFILAMAFIKIYRKTREVTVPGIIEKFFDVRCRIVSSIILVIIMITVGSLQIVAAGAVLSTVIGAKFSLMVILTGAIFIIYTMFGGLWSIAFTNLLHIVVMYIGIIVGLMAVTKDVGGIVYLKSQLPSYPFFSMTGIGTAKVVAWVIASVTAAIPAQAGVQPLLAAKDERVSQRAGAIAALIVAPMGFFSALLGMAALVKFPGINPKMALPQLMMTLSPYTGGIVLAGIMAAILSTVGPCMLAAGTLLTKDLYLRLVNPTAHEEKIYWISRFLTLLSGIVMVTIALSAPVILEAIYFIYTLRGTIFIILAFGIYWKKTKASAALWALILTTLVVLGWEISKAMNNVYPFNLHPMYIALCISVIITIAGSLLCNKVRK